MKTINEKAQKYAVKTNCQPCINKDTDKDCTACNFSENSYNGFIAGAAFAQQWYDVNDVLPKVDNSFSDKVLIKDNNDEVFLAELWDNGEWEVYSTRAKTDILFWRPISIE